MKKFIIHGLFFVLGCFLFGLYNVQNSHPNSSIGKRYLGNSFKTISWYEWNSFLDLKSYGFGKPSSEDALSDVTKSKLGLAGEMMISGIP